MRLKKTAIAMTLAGLCALGCSGSSPTSSSGFILAFTVPMANTANQPTILAAQLLFDGVTVEVSAQAQGFTATTFLVSSGAQSGPQTLQVLLNSQTSSPNSYTVTMPSVVVADANGNVLKTIQLSTQTAILATGGSINYSFSI
jgi:hypothetical protein